MAKAVISWRATLGADRRVYDLVPRRLLFDMEWNAKHLIEPTQRIRRKRKNSVTL